MSDESLRHIAFNHSSDAAGTEWHLLAVGDMCVAPGGVRQGAEDMEYMMPRIEGTLAGRIRDAAIAVANLEGAVAGSEALSKAGPAVEIDPLLPRWARAAGFDLLTLANNHIMDWGRAGLAAVTDACRAEGLAICGAGKDAADAMRASVHTVPGDVRVAVLAFCEREFGIAGPDVPGAAWVGHPEALARVREAARENDVVIVIAHGGVEEIPLPPPARQDQLRAFIDAGARVVIGHHPHVPQGWELYGAGAIFHSLGNFLFDYPEGIRYPKTEWGLALDLRFLGSTLLGAEVVPIEALPERVVREVADRERADAMLHHLVTTNAVLADRATFESYWQALALHLWRTRYRRWLQRASGAGAGGNIRTHLKGLAGALKRRLGRASGPAGASALPNLGNPLMLLNLVRNESHRWAIECALAIESGDEPDRTTPEILRHVRELLRWTEEDAG